MNAAYVGLTMLLVLGWGTLRSGLPIWAVLIGTASLYAFVGVLTGVFEAGVLEILPGRVLGLLEHDLLQAMPLYVLLGVLLHTLPLARALHRCAAFSLQSLGLPTAPAALLVGAVFAPMNGSVASSGLMLARILPSPQGAGQARQAALLAAAATVGVVVPPSLVLLLLGDTMMRSHLEAVKLAPAVLGNQQIINTQTLLQTAALPAAVLLVAWLLVAIFAARRQTISLRAPNPSVREWAIATALIGGIGGLFAAVFMGVLFPVEAAASGCCLLLCAAMIRRALSVQAWSQLLAETLQISGALFAILLGATTFSLVLRAWGSDVALAQSLSALPGEPWFKALLMLLLLGACAWVLDAFEMIFVIVPIVAPILIAQLGDAAQAAVILLLVLQTSFLLPPLGYAVMMVKPPHLRSREFLQALVPYIAVPVLVIVLIMTVPRSLYWLAPTPTTAVVLSDEAINQAMNAVGENAEKEAIQRSQDPPQKP